MGNLFSSKLNRYEVLAPAGSYECMTAAFNAGADAVYVGGDLFGARAFAGNFNEEELLSAIDYAHVRGKKIFLTVNTLLKNQEIEKKLYAYIKPYYERGLDAVIVQDYGVLSFVRRYFPDIDVHASTQMTVTGSSFAKELKSLGVTRIVPARELSCNEIKKIYDETGLEIECFVHGALCYCYSGQCLLSSVIGGRSGNRGRCAQPCRLPYDVEFGDKIFKRQYALSPKDLCTLSLIPDILESGVYSLKIEGRMKKPEYVASVTSMYRKYVDLYLEKGRAGYKVDENDIEILKDIYNRGGFTDGYYERHNGPEIMSIYRPNHMGTIVAKITKTDAKKRVITAKACKDIHREDVLEIFTDNGQSIYVQSDNIKNNSIFTIDSRMLKSKSEENNDRNDVFNKVLMSNKGNIMRTRNNQLINDITQKYLIKDRCPVVCGCSVVIYKDMPVAVDVWSDDYNVHLEGAVPEIAGNRPVTADDIKKQFLKTGGTDFIFDIAQVNIVVDEGLFVNIKELNRLRRDALDMLRKKILLVYHRDIKESSNCIYEKQSECSDIVYVSALVSNINQFDVVVSHNTVNLVYAESDILGSDELENWDELIKKCHLNKKEIYMALPYITRDKAKQFIEKNISFFKDNKLDGYIFRNMETYMFFMDMNLDVKKFVFDNSIYAFNNRGMDFLEKYNPFLITESFELNSSELIHLKSDRKETTVYGYIPVMVSAGCIKKTYNRCDNKMEKTILKDRLGNNFFLINHCAYCYNVIYNSKPLMLYDMSEDELKTKSLVYRYNFVTESADEIKKILDGVIVKDFTRGHFKRGVE